MGFKTLDPFFIWKDVIDMQPISGDQWANIGTGAVAGVISSAPTVFRKVVIPGTYVGTMAFYDASGTAGTSADTLIATFGLPTTRFGQVYPLDIQCKNGLEYESTGTPSMTVTWG